MRKQTINMVTESDEFKMSFRTAIAGRNHIFQCEYSVCTLQYLCNGSSHYACKSLKKQFLVMQYMAHERGGTEIKF